MTNEVLDWENKLLGWKKAGLSAKKAIGIRFVSAENFAECLKNNLFPYTQGAFGLGIYFRAFGESPKDVINEGIRVYGKGNAFSGYCIRHGFPKDLANNIKDRIGLGKNVDQILADSRLQSGFNDLAESMTESGLKKIMGDADERAPVLVGISRKVLGKVPRTYFDITDPADSCVATSSRLPENQIGIAPDLLISGVKFDSYKQRKEILDMVYNRELVS